MQNKQLKTIINAIIVCLMLAVVVWAFFWGKANGSMEATAWALVPPVIAIVLALVTKEVYSSLFVGILVGALFFSNFNLETAYVTLVQDGFIASLADSWNMGIIVFLVVLGIFVVLMNRAGGSAAYGNWAVKNIKGKKGAMLGTFGLGALIFVDDYFNCLTVGSVMRPVTDKFNISRAKLAYIIDATAAPICMIAPISSWAAAVAGVMSEDSDGFSLFIQAIPYNLYSLLTIAMVILICIWGLDFGPMKKHEANAAKGDLYTTPDRPYAGAAEEAVSKKGKVLDLVLPVVVLIAFCIAGLMYTGYQGGATNIIQAFSGCDAALGLSLGSILALVVTIVYYLCRRVLSFEEIMKAFPDGFKAMVPAIMILVFAWTLSGITGMLQADVFVEGVFANASQNLVGFVPALVFIIAVGLAFSTGTSWGTFGILLPIVVAISALDGNLLTMSIAACLAGAVCGDHCSPISDTTIMASSGAQCNHVNHVSTQLPYAMLVAGVSFVGYLAGGYIFKNAWLTLAFGLALLVGALFVIKKLQEKKAA
ncbi:MAG: Na+/H+ antiporter NhaC family protein [Firmicutes bacterium]|nr:Na+/H+ antiporter NhaC family protein [Bacillota bacterium]